MPGPWVSNIVAWGALVCVGACSAGAPGPRASDGPTAAGSPPPSSGAEPTATAPVETSPQPSDTNRANPTGTSTKALSLALSLDAPGFDPDAPGLAALAALEVSLVEASLLLADGSGQPQMATPVPAAACKTPAAGGAALACSLALAGVDPTAFPQGAAIKVRDLRASPQGPQWATIYSFLGPDALAAAQANSPLSVTATILSSAGLERVATWAGLAATDLTANGAVLGTLRASATSSTPLAGATIKPSQSGLLVGYAGADGRPAPAPTSTLGMFVATPPKARSVMTATWRIILPDGAGTSRTIGPTFGATGGVIAALTFVGP